MKIGWSPRSCLLIWLSFAIPTAAWPVQLANPTVAQSATMEIAKTIRVGPNQALKTIAAAAKIAKDGDTVEIESGDYVGDVAIWTQDRLTVRAIGGKATLIAAGQSAQAKAIWVIRGGTVTVENIVFKGAKVADRNGAGIRFEKGLLVVRNCAFLNNENGILTGGGGISELIIENSEFGYNGFGDGQSHGIYVGAIKRLQVTGSYFHHNNEGHLIKSRAAENHVMYNRLTDETGGTASYELEFPNGGLAYVVGNIIQQSSTTSNSTIISFGAEGYSRHQNELYLTHNTIVDDRPSNGIFLNVKPGAQKVYAVNNLLVGKGELTGRPPTGLRQMITNLGKQILSDTPSPQQSNTPTQNIVLKNNPTMDWSSFAQASRFDYRITQVAREKMTVDKIDLHQERSLVPQKEYIHPANTRSLGTKAPMPGAIQSLVIQQ